MCSKRRCRYRLRKIMVRVSIRVIVHVNKVLRWNVLSLSGVNTPRRIQPEWASQSTSFQPPSCPLSRGKNNTRWSLWICHHFECGKQNWLFRPCSCARPASKIVVSATEFHAYTADVWWNSPSTDSQPCCQCPRGTEVQTDVLQLEQSSDDGETAELCESRQDGEDEKLKRLQRTKKREGLILNGTYWRRTKVCCLP